LRVKALGVANPELHFEWDPPKALDNIREHGVSFEEAQTVFDDPLAQDIDDPRYEEDRYVIRGLASYKGKLRYLVVGYTQRGPNIRIITAWKMSPDERRDYANGPR
jgi:uncharacterized DUF497 family protein